MVVCGATGRQGGAVIRELLKDGSFDVVGLTRDDTSESALRLRRLGVEVVVADHMDQASLIKAFVGADFVFGVTQPWDARQRRFDSRREILQGKNIIWASAAAAVSHLVFSSFINPFDEKTGVTFIDSKLTIEKQITELGVPHTIIRSPFFMDDIALPAPGENIIRHHYNLDTKLPYFCLSDLGKLVVNVVLKRERYLDKTITTVGDIKTGKEIAAMLSEVSGIRCRCKSQSPLLLRLFRPQIFHLRHFMNSLPENGCIRFLPEAFLNASFPESKYITIDQFLETKYIGK